MFSESARILIEYSTELALNSGAISFTDLAGRQLYQVEFESGVSNQIQIEVPATFGSGMKTIAFISSNLS